jgi:putative hemolysin
MWHLLLQFILIFINAFFSAAELALISFNEARAEKEAEAGSRNAARLLSLKREPEKFLATIQVGITLAGFLASAFAAKDFSEALVAFFARVAPAAPLDVLKNCALVVITVILSLFTITLGELVPKRIAMKKPDELAHWFALPLLVITRLFAPLVWLLSAATNLFLRVARLNPASTDENEVTEEDIRLMVDAGGAQGNIEKSEQKIINNVFEFDDRSADTLMTHRTKTVILWLRDNDSVWERAIIEKRHNMYPICGDTIDDIRGVLSTRDFLLLDAHDRQTVLTSAMHAAQFVPESIKADVLFRKMKQSGKHFAIVLDEYGGFSGVITMNDVLAAIVGRF